MTRALLTFVFFSLAFGAGAQKNLDAIAFFAELSDCAASLGGWKCLELDLSSEARDGNDTMKVYQYSWNFGDGNRKQGNKIEHCYEDFGSYQVTMDLIDTETNTVIRNELSSTVHLYPELYPTIASRTDNLPPAFMEFSCKYPVESFEPDRIYWRIDGAHYEGRSIQHAFPVAGVYTVEMAVVKDMGFLGTVTACSTRDVTIDESDVWTNRITEFISGIRKKQETGPFASGDVICYLRPIKSGSSKSVLTSLATLMSQVSLKTSGEYEVMLFSGNLFTPTKKLDMRGISGNDLYLALQDTISSFLHHPMAVIPALKPGSGDPTSLSEDQDLKAIADLLRQHPQFRIAVGAYLSSGSRIHKGMQSSIARAEAVKAALVSSGIAAERISVASPENNRALINTCSAIVDCDWEDPSLNGKIEFKITGTTL